METNTHNIYLFKAFDAYSYSLEETMEALNYALSYDPENTEALYLMAQVYAFQLKDYETAKAYFEKLMGIDVKMPKIYPNYIWVLMRNEDYPQAQRLLEFALTVKGTDKPLLRLLQGQLLESQNVLKASLAAFEMAKDEGGNSDFINYVKGEIERVKDKRSSRKEKKKNKKKKKSSSKKKK
ncbi:tetratricopeptide repeat protein [Aureisphaera galaxeae]|uniref:tetratricopeptide repeat protein n=1 Tax=Aureisphaera galaxeae TaxID=1538023 RepID=UPI00234FC743|nr:tetratricopeptide repeat protein [Aureisphaera galaxeae]MDC8005433.1 tetratricopeptide repeat protein [Aureisphaera galaxeae]